MSVHHSFIASACLLLATLNCSVFAGKKLINAGKAHRETSLTDEDFALARKRPVLLKEFGGQGKDRDPTLGYMTEGDISLSPEELKDVERGSAYIGRAALQSHYSKWPNKTVPYTISSQYSGDARVVIAQAMQEFHDRTCIRFVPRDEAQHRHYVAIAPIDGCFSSIGRTGGRQDLSLSERCLYKGVIMHELMHLIGFFHEQSRGDRDENVAIRWANIITGLEDQFRRYDSNIADMLHEPYDYNSIMHYNPYAFTANGERTIQALKKGGGQMGQRTGFSDIDTRKINKHYQCPDALLSTDPSSNTSQATPTVTTPICEDKDWKCRIWDDKGYCESDERVSKDLCRKTCGTCTAAVTTTTEPEDCVDRTPACDGWAQRGHCTDDFSGHVVPYCQKACNLC